MSMFWSESLSENADGVRVCAVCGQVDCRGEDEGLRPDLRETVDTTPHTIDEPFEETR
jgi:hypothetical protein